MTDQRFRRGQHIRHRTDFQHVYDRGRKLHGRTMTIFLLHRPEADDAAGDCRHEEDWAAPSSAIAPSASSARFFAGNPAPPGYDIVVVPRRAVFDASFSSLESEYVATVGRLGAPARSR